MGLCVLYFLMWLGGASAWAQSDPSSTFLLNFGSSDPEEAGLESGRYQTRPSSAPSPLPMSPVLQAPKPPSPKTPEVRAVEESVEKEEFTPPEASSLEMDLMRPKEKVPSVDSKVIDFQLGTALQYGSSSSPSWFRRYSAPGIGVNLEGVVWLTSEWGVSGYFGQSLGERFSDSYQSVSFVGQRHQDMAIGLHSRIHGSSMRVQSEFGAYYYERARRVERQAKMQGDWETQGLMFRFKYNWLDSDSRPERGGYFDFQIYPRAYHRDSLADGQGLGTHHETYGGKLRWGRTIHLSESNRIFWGLGGQVEQNRFTGEAKVIEPNGNKVKGVYGIHSTFFLEFGLGWSQ